MGTLTAMWSLAHARRSRRPYPVGRPSRQQVGRAMTTPNDGFPVGTRAPAPYEKPKTERLGTFQELAFGGPLFDRSTIESPDACALSGNPSAYPGTKS